MGFTCRCLRNNLGHVSWGPVLGHLSWVPAAQLVHFGFLVVLGLIFVGSCVYMAALAFCLFLPWLPWPSVSSLAALGFLSSLD